MNISSKKEYEYQLKERDRRIREQIERQRLALAASGRPDFKDKVYTCTIVYDV